MHFLPRDGCRCGTATLARPLQHLQPPGRMDNQSPLRGRFFHIGLHLRTHPLCRSDAERGTIEVGGTHNQLRWGSTERGRREKEPTMGEMSSRIARRDFTEQFGRGELSGRRPVVRTRTARILPDDWAIAGGVLGLGIGAASFQERVDARVWLLPVCRQAGSYFAASAVTPSSCSSGFHATALECPFVDSWMVAP